jgi:hypothetical protein
VRLRRPSPSLLIALAAVVLASAGSATAARLITGKQIKNGSIASADVRDGSLVRGDFKAGQVPAGPRGAQGPQGPRGATGARGANGTNGFGLLRYPSVKQTFADGDANMVQVECPAGTYAVGGAAWAADTATLVTDHPEVITSSGLLYTDADIGAGWFANVSNVNSGSVDVTVELVCANAAQVSSTKARHRRLVR